MDIPLVDLKAQQREIEEELWPALKELFSEASFVGGTSVSNFEESYAEFIGARHCVGVANGTDALELALRATGIGSGDEVIVPANTFIASVEAVARIGAIPVLVDVLPGALLIDPQRVQEAVTVRTRAMIPVHLFGQTAPVEQLEVIAEQLDLKIIEDAAQAQGAKRNGQYAGTMGHIAATSFYPGKNLGAAGDAGAVTTNDEELAQKVRLLASHGSQTKYVHEVLGMNSRLDALQAVVLRTKLRRLEEWNNQRRQAANYYTEMLTGIADIQTPTPLTGNEDVWHLYVIQIPHRDRVHEALKGKGIQAGVHYPVPIHQTPAWIASGHIIGEFPEAEFASSRILSLPLYPQISRTQQECVAETLVAELSMITP